MKFGDVVLYEEMNKLYTATVLGIRVLDDHSGEDDEPLLALGFFKEVTMPGPNGVFVPKSVIGTSAQDSLAQFRIDVAHESHTYTAAQQKKYGVAVYPGGRWQEIDNAPSTFRGTQSVEEAKASGDKVRLQKVAAQAQNNANRALSLEDKIRLQKIADDAKARAAAAKSSEDVAKLQKTADTAQAAATDAKIDVMDASNEVKPAAEKVADEKQAVADVAQGRATGGKGVQ